MPKMSALHVPLQISLIPTLKLVNLALNTTIMMLLKENVSAAL